MNLGSKLNFNIIFVRLFIPIVVSCCNIHIVIIVVKSNNIYDFIESCSHFCHLFLIWKIVSYISLGTTQTFFVFLYGNIWNDALLNDFHKFILNLQVSHLTQNITHHLTCSHMSQFVRQSLNGWQWDKACIQWPSTCSAVYYIDLTS